MPKHNLKLKIGCPIILLRNLNKAAGLANGTRLVITKLNDYTIFGTIVTQGIFYGNEVMIPRIDLIADSKSTPFKFKRRQFPVQVAYCMTIHKSQGQSFDKIGIYLPKDLFTHGQLYVALSRVGRAGGVFMLIKDEVTQLNKKHTNNVVFSSALQTEGYTIRQSQINHSLQSNTSEAIQVQHGNIIIDDDDDNDNNEHDNNNNADIVDMNADNTLQVSINALQTYMENFDNPHSVTMSWAIMPLLHSVFKIYHAFQPGLKYYVNTVLQDENAYTNIVYSIKSYFDRKKITYNSIHWIGTQQYINANDQEQLLNFSFDNNGSQTNMGNYFCEICHDVINIMVPPQNMEEI